MDCIVEFFFSTSSLMRFTSLKGLGQWKEIPSYSKKFILRMVILLNDTNDDVKAEAMSFQSKWSLLFETDDLGDQLVVELISEYVHLQTACSAALAQWLCKYPSKGSRILQLLISLYKEMSKV